MKKLIPLFILMAMFAGCGGTIYHGKYITVKTKEEPKDEWKLGDYVVLAWENGTIKQDDKWVYRFEIYRRETLVDEYLVRSEKVDSKRYYLKQVRDDGMKTVASFDTKPGYDAVKDRVMAQLKMK